MTALRSGALTALKEHRAEAQPTSPWSLDFGCKINLGNTTREPLPNLLYHSSKYLTMEFESD
jgi:hypothetical protein